MTYAEYLKSIGATDEDIKVMDTAVGRKAFEKMQADLAAATTERDTVKKNYTDYQDQVATWYDENDAKLKVMQNKVVVSESEAARAKAAILKAQEQGLVDIAKDLGYTVEPPPKTSGTAPDGFDASKFVTRDDIAGIAEQVGTNLAKLQDMVAEHMQLFPNIKLNVTALRAEALAAKTAIDQYWERKYKVPEAREAAAAALQAAHDKKVADDAVSAARTEWVSKYGDPNLRPLVPSVVPLFKKREGDTLRAKQPWEHADSTLSNDRVTRAAKHLVETTVTH